MSTILYPPARPRTLAEMLDASLRIFRVSLLKCLPFATLAILAGVASLALSFGRLSVLYDPSSASMTLPNATGNSGRMLLTSLGAFLAALTWLIMAMTTLLRQSNVAAGRAVGGPSDVLAVIKRAPAIASLALLLGACEDVLILPLLLLAEPYRTMGALVALPILLFLGVTLLLLPACAVILSQKRLLASLGYSFKLIRGNWWRVAGVYAVGLSIMMVFYLLAAVAAAAAQPYATGREAAAVMAVISAAQLAVGAVGLTFFCALTLSVFGDLEIRRGLKSG